MQKLTQEQRESNFVEEDITCPVCESYNVEELTFTFACHNCNTTWKILTLGS